MLITTDLLSIPFLALYAETHFRFFPFFPSLLFKRQPEVLFDLPKRLDPSAPYLPILLVTNDIDRFPVKLSECSIAVSQTAQKPKRFDFPDLTQSEILHPLHKSMKVLLLRIPRQELPSGLIHVTAMVKTQRGKQSRIVINDNFHGTPKYPFSCFIANDRLPGAEFCSYGDLHVHSLFSQSHVEFGTPISVIDLMTKSNGLDFCAITDHSYDLACTVENYLTPDPKVTRWRLFREECEKKQKFQSIVIPGEEISCLNGKGEVVHLCGLNLRDFLPGNLDGARKGRGKDTQLSVFNAIQKIHDQGGIAIPAHPGARIGFMQRFFLCRGSWSEGDLAQTIDGMQIMNCGVSPLFEHGKILWIHQLLLGKKVPIVAGNDAHGDFNRYRSIAIPFISLYDRLDFFFGNGKTGLYGSPRSCEGILEAIRQGKTFVTTGPFISMSISGSAGDAAISHFPISREIKKIFVHVRSTEEFGIIKGIKILSGKKGDTIESVVFSKNYEQCGSFSIDAEIDCNALKKDTLYLRAEAECIVPRRQPSSAFTSPVYFG